MVRDIITIDEELCNGCGLCIPNCPEGALQLIDGKAKLVRDSFCDGLGACLGECPEGAITVEKREADTYDEAEVIKNVVARGEDVTAAHIDHLRSHGETEALEIAEEFLQKSRKVEASTCSDCAQASGNAGVNEKSSDQAKTAGAGVSELKQWPVQMHLISPEAPYFAESDVVIAADCAGYAAGDFHERFLRGRTIAIGCPKFDSDQDSYRDKIRRLIDDAKISSLTVVIMEVPCCGGLLKLAIDAAEASTRSIPVHAQMLGIDGQVKGNQVFNE